MLRRILLIVSPLLVCHLAVVAEAASPAPKVVIIAGPKSHGPVGNGIHDYGWSAKLLKVMLDNSNVAEQLRVEIHTDGWPADVATLDDAATIMVISDGRDGPAFAEAPHLASPENIAAIQKQIDRGCGFLTFHFSTFAPDAYAAQVLDWSGGYFDWETDGERKWYSNIQTLDADVRPAMPEHPVLRGVGPFQVHEEFYYDLRFNSEAGGVTPIWTVPALPGREPDGTVVAWARERPSGGRGFGTTGGHFYANWESPEFRRTILNALVWTAGLDVPAEGVAAPYYTHGEITKALAGVEGTARATAKPIKALILTRAQYPGHVWQDTTSALRAALQLDRRMQVTVSEQIEDLATDTISDHDVLILNYCNWKLPGLSEAAKAGFVTYLQNGGGLVIVHFANGAFHFSLPEAGDSDWPEYRNICRRAWNHHGDSGHDAYGKFIVEIDDHEHPITRSLEPFETIDELYFRQAGDAPIHVLASARSQVTGQREPMAFVYEYGQGRVFQTVLGHAAESLRSDGTAELICRAAAWAAGRDPLDIAAGPAAVAQQAAAKPQASAEDRAPLADGKFGAALDARAGAVFAPPQPQFAAPPLTVELWAKLDQRDDYNILVANESKASATHWEIFSHPGNGHLTVYLPGLVPDHVHTRTDIADEQWHFISMQYAPDRIRLYVDGQLAGDQAVAPATSAVLPQIPGDLGIGSLVSRKLGCGGLIDDVRISSGLRAGEHVPSAPLTKDDHTLALWTFDAIADNVVNDATGASSARWESSTSARGTPVRLQRRKDQDAIDWAQGFLWADEASREDERWNQMQIGRVLASIIQFTSGPVAKGLSIQLGEHGDAAVTYDTERMSVRAGWTGAFLKFDPNRFGLINPPAPAGDLQFETPPIDGWTGGEIAFRGQHRHNQSVLLEYTVGGTRVLELPALNKVGEHAAFVRQLEVAPHNAPLTLQLGKFGDEAKLIERNGATMVVRGELCIAISGQRAPALAINQDGVITATLAASQHTARFDILLCRIDEPQLDAFAGAIAQLPPPTGLDALLQPGDRQWPETLTTRGTLGEDDDAYTVDTIAVPFDNPYRALIFTSGHDFFSDGRAAVSAIHGDVWLVDGIDADLDAVTWTRFATGLFQPLGVKIVNDQVYVLGRDQITRLHDTNGDGEADFYENFASGYLTSTGGHDYVACLETDPQGNFYFVHGVDGVLRVPPTGGRATAIATGLRNPNGLGVGPQGMITAAPQEGEWTPVSNIAVVRDGDHFGYKGPKITDTRPLGYDPPLCWIPRLMDNSSGGQVWATGDKWGPLNGRMLHLSFGQCKALLTLMEEVDGQWQGGTVSLPWNFQSGAMRGRVHPLDGQVYVTGLKGWTTRAADDGCLQRIRYTGKPVYLPTGVKTYANGLALTFTAPLDPAIAQDPDSYHAEQWNYLWSQAYGSADYKPSQPGIEGHDPVEIKSATLLPDGKTVFLEIPNLAPVMQLKVAYQLTAADGRELHNTYYGTLNRVPATLFPDSQIVRVERQRLPPEIEAALKPGLHADFVSPRPEQLSAIDSRVERLAAVSVAAGDPASSLSQPSPFDASYSGYLHVPLRGDYAFSLEGCGAVRLQINESEFLSGESDDLETVGTARVRLHTGYNLVRLEYSSPEQGAARFRLLWEHETFAREPVPPTAWFYRSDIPDALADVRRGRELFATRHCDRCHSAPPMEPARMPERALDPPNLARIGSRLNSGWVAQWLLNPPSHRPQATMPALFDPNDPQSAQQAADVAAYIAALGTETHNVSRETFGSPEPGDPAAVAQAIEVGAQLYEHLACLACHRLTPPEEPDDFDRISLSRVGRKYRPGQLAAFLTMPQRHHQGTRMPDFQLSPIEAQALAAFLISRSNLETSDPSALVGDETRGRQVFEQQRCVACHATEATARVAVLPGGPIPIVDKSRGCLAAAAADRGSAPQIKLSAEESLSLRSFISFGVASLDEGNPAEAAERLIRRYNCGACHSRDGETSPRQALILEEGTGVIPDALPTLTWTGEKLRAGWLERFLAGERHAPLRPWLKARMPAFPAIAHVLADGLRAQHGIADEEDVPFDPDPALVEIGSELSAPTALDCRQCHGVGNQEPGGDIRTQIALGVNFSATRERLRRDYYDRFMLNPPRCDPALRMPILAPDGQTTKITTVFGGNASQQFDALWHYIQSAPPRPELRADGRE